MASDELCIKCKGPRGDSYKSGTRSGKPAFSSRCKSCDKRRISDRQRLQNTGCDEETYNRLLRLQKRRCAICQSRSPGKRRTRFCADHNHRTRQVRGLLCSACNLGLGKFQDSRRLLARALLYLEG